MHDEAHLEELRTIRDHIRNFILDGWLGIRFDGEPLIEKPSS